MIQLVMLQRISKAGLLVLLVCSTFGCGRSAPNTAELNAALPTEIRSIIGQHLNKSPDSLSPDSTFAALGADDLDVVEITTAAEEKFGVVIEDDKLARAAGASGDEKLADRLTLGAFAQVATSAPKQSADTKPSQTDLKSNELREAQVGTFAELSKISNPHQFVLVFVPRLETLTSQSEKQLGRSLTEAERVALKNKAAVIALPQEAAAKMKQAQAKRESNLGSQH